MHLSFAHASPTRTRILSVGSDWTLLQTRQMLLEQAGALVYSTGFSAAVLIASTECFDILLLCLTLLEWEVICLRSLAARLDPACRFVLIDNLRQVRLRDSVSEPIVTWARGPRELLQSILSTPVPPQP